MRIGAVKLEKLQPSDPDTDIVTADSHRDAQVEPIRITGPDNLDLLVADSRSRNGQRDIRVIEAHGPPQADALVGRLGLTVRPLDGRVASCDLRQARVKLNTEPFQVSLYQADGVALTRGAGLDVARSITKRGGVVGTKCDLLQDDSRSRNGWSCVFPRNDADIPLAAFVMTRVLPVLNMWFVPTSTEYEDYRIPPRSAHAGGRSIYVVLLGDRAGTSPKPKRPPVYVGQTGKTRADRFREHKIGYKKSRYVYAHGLRLMPELYPKTDRIWSSEKAEEIEATWAAELRNRGHLVFGGH